MALSAKEAAALAIIGIDELMLKGRGVTARTIKSLGRAAVKLTPYVARGAVAGAPIAARTIGTLAAANPYSTGVGLGASFLATQPGQQLLSAAEERGQMDRVRAQQAFDEWYYGHVTRPGEMVQQTLASPTFQKAVVKRAKRKVSTYSRAIKRGMAAVKKSKFNGKAGKITNVKKTFGTVAKTVSKAKKGVKLSTKGVTGVIKKAISRYTKGWKLTKRGKPQRYTGGQR